MFLGETTAHSFRIFCVYSQRANSSLPDFPPSSASLAETLGLTQEKKSPASPRDSSSRCGCESSSPAVHLKFCELPEQHWLTFNWLCTKLVIGPGCADTSSYRSCIKRGKNEDSVPYLCISTLKHICRLGLCYCWYRCGVGSCQPVSLDHTLRNTAEYRPTM